MSNLWKLGLNDWQKGLIVAVLTAVLTVIYESISVGGLIFDYKIVLTTGILAGISYLLKNVLTGSGGQILTNKLPPPTLPKSIKK